MSGVCAGRARNRNRVSRRPAGVAASTACGTSFARSSVARPAGMPCCCANASICAGGNTFSMSPALIGRLVPLPTHELTCWPRPALWEFRYEAGHATRIGENRREQARCSLLVLARNQGTQAAECRPEETAHVPRLEMLPHSIGLQIASQASCCTVAGKTGQHTRPLTKQAFAWKHTPCSAYFPASSPPAIPTDRQLSRRNPELGVPAGRPRMRVLRGRSACHHELAGSCPHSGRKRWKWQQQCLPAGSTRSVRPSLCSRL